MTETNQKQLGKTSGTPNDWDMLREQNPVKKPTFDAVVANPLFMLPLGTSKPFSTLS